MKQIGNIIVGIIAIAAIILAGLSLSSVKQDKTMSVADKVINSGEIRVGYIIYSPYLIKDQATGNLSGISYDLVEAAAKKLNLKTNWVEEVGWGTAIEGLKAKRYDMVGTQMWPSSDRAREAIFSVAPMNNVVYPYVRIDDNRFNNDLTKINSSNVTIISTDGDVAVSIAKEDYPLAKLIVTPQLTSKAEQYQSIVGKKGDVVFMEPSSANDFIKSNPGTIKQVGNAPIRTFGNSFLFARGEDSIKEMWDVALNELISDGSVARALEKYNASGSLSVNK